MASNKFEAIFFTFLFESVNYKKYFELNKTIFTPYFLHFT